MSDIEKIKKLREATGAGFKDCNLAIKESNGDLDKAVEILRIKGISKASKKMSRDAKEVRRLCRFASPNFNDDPYNEIEKTISFINS